MSTLTVGNGVSVHYEDTGQGDPIILIPGLAMCGWHYRRQLPLAEKYRVITFDPRGFGDSSDSDAGLTLRQIAADIRQLILELDLNRVTLLGWSMGSFVLYEYLKQFGNDRLKAIISVDMTPRNTLGEAWDIAVFGNLTPEGIIGVGGSIIDDKEEWLRGLAVACFAEGSTPPEGVVDEWTVEMVKSSTASLLGYWLDLGRSDWREFVKTIEVPSLFIHGAKSQAVPPTAGPWLEQAVPNSRLVMMEQSGHAPFWEEAEKFNAEVDSFLQQI